jgi:hypothetical protein
VDITTSFDIGTGYSGDPVTQTQAVAGTTVYRYWRLLGTSGTSVNWGYLYELTFKISVDLTATQSLVNFGGTNTAGATSSGPGRSVPAWKRYNVLKIPNLTGDCATTKGCWSINGGASVPATATTSQAVIWLAAPANAVLERARLKTTAACAGITAITVSDMGTTASASEFATGLTYNLMTAVSVTNLLWPTLLTPGLTAAGTNWSVTVNGAAQNVDDITDGCAFDVEAQWSVLP